MHQPTWANVQKNKSIVLGKYGVKWSTREEVPCPRGRTATHRGHASLRLRVAAGKEAPGRVQNGIKQSTRIQASHVCEGPARRPSPLSDRSPSLCLQQHRDPGTRGPAGPGHRSPFGSPCLAHWASVRVETLLSSKLIFKTTIMSTASTGLGKSSRAEAEGRKPRLVTGPAPLRGPYGRKTGRGRPCSRPLSRQQRNPLKAPLTGLPN